jgi:AraC family transcriptional regulator
MRRVERAQQLLQQDRNLSLAEIAACAGFSDQSQFCHHFKRLVGVTPGQFSRQCKMTSTQRGPHRTGRAGQF